VPCTSLEHAKTSNSSPRFGDLVTAPASSDCVCIQLHEGLHGSGTALAEFIRDNLSSDNAFVRQKVCRAVLEYAGNAPLAALLGVGLERSEFGSQYGHLSMHKVSLWANPFSHS
jgi:hypothetical protein